MGFKGNFLISNNKKEYYYDKEELSEKEGFELADLEMAFAELDGWEAEYNAEKTC